MKLASHIRYDAHRSRTRAFTLIELLVVIAIIGVLSGLAAVAVFRFIGRQRAQNSEALIKTVQEVLKRHWTKVIEEAKKEAIPPAVLTLGGSPERARILWIKLRLTEAFPASYYEAQFPPAFYDHGGANTWISLIPANRRHPSVSSYQDKLKITGVVGPASAVERSTESSACLLAALSVSHGGAAPLTVDMLPIAPLDTDGDGVKELVDGWGNPIDFFRFPTRHAELQNANPAARDAGGNRTIGDPLDPVKFTGPPPYYYQLTFSSAPSTWWTSNARRIHQEVCRYSLEDANIPFSYYTLPVIVSRGADGILKPDDVTPLDLTCRSGLKIHELNVPGGVPFVGVPPSPRPTWRTLGDFADMSVVAPAIETDNIYSFKLAAPQ